MKRLLLLCCSIIITITATSQQINEPYSFPIKPGIKEWADLVTEGSRFNAMQIPGDLLSKMTTRALVVSCLNFPAFGHISAYDNIQTGYLILSSKFNGLTELSKRSDAGRNLIEYYKIAGNKGFEPAQENLEQQFWSIKLTWIELLIAQDNIIQSMSKEEKTSLLFVAQEKYNMKQSNVDFGNSVLSTVFLIGKLLHSMNLPDFELEYTQNTGLRTFLVTSKLPDTMVISNLIQYNQKYLNVK